MNYKLLKNKSFFLLMQGSFVSQIGSLMQTFALSLYVLNQYNSATLFASILIVSMIPRLVLGPFAGVFVDWMDRKKIIVRLDFLSGIVVAIMAALYFVEGQLPLWSIYGGVIGLSLIGTLFNPAVSTIMPTILHKEQLVDGNAISSVIMTIANIFSPLLSGLLMSISNIGIILAFNAVSFVISAISEMFIVMPVKVVEKSERNLKSFKTDFKEGISFMINTKFILMIGIVACALNFAISPVFSVAIPFVLKKVMVIKDFEFGLLNGIIATASIIGGVLAPRVSKKISTNKILLIDFVTQPIIVGLIAIITSNMVLSKFSTYYPVLIMLIIVQYILIIVLTLGNVVINSTLQKEIPNQLLGRVGTVIGTFAMGAIPIGQGIFGLLLEKFDAWVPMLGSTIVLLIVVVFIYPFIREDKNIEANEINKAV